MSKNRKYFVYVIRLRKQVMELKRWRRDNPKQATEECFYVGQSAHAPECRFNQHIQKKNSECTCICHHIPGKVVRGTSIGTAKYASTHSLSLCPEHYSHYNPIDSEQESKNLEMEIALKLRSMGHGAHFG